MYLQIRHGIYKLAERESISPFPSLYVTRLVVFVLCFVRIFTTFLVVNLLGGFMSGDYSKMKAALGSLRSNAVNIQYLLRMAQDGKNSTEILTRITHAIENHFERIESLPIGIPEESLEDHRDILKHFKNVHADWLARTISDADYAEALNFRLFNHFSSCFQPLLEAHLDEISKLESRI